MDAFGDPELDRFERFAAGVEFQAAFGRVECFVDSGNSNRLGDGNVDLIKSAREEITVLTGLQSLNASSEHLDTILLENALGIHLYTQVQRSLSTEAEENAIRLLLLNDIFGVFGCYRQVVNFVGEHVGRLDGSNIGVEKDGLDASFLEGLECL